MGATSPKGVQDLQTFSLFDALLGRRSRRFAMGAVLPDGPLAYASNAKPLPLTELEKMIVLCAAAGNTGWHHMIYRHERYAPHLSNYSGAAGGRTFPSAAGLHIAQLFFTNDEGVYFFDTRDMPAVIPQGGQDVDLEGFLAAHRPCVRKLADGRLNIPHAEPHMEGHNTWCVNVPGSLLVIPVSDIAQHMVALLCFLVQNGYCIYDDLNDTRIPGIERFRSIVDPAEPFPLSFVETYALTEATAELTCSAFAGMLALQAMGLGGWMPDGIDRFTVLGASGKPDVPGLGFRYDTNDRWALPNPTGLPGVFEGYCPPHYPDMRAAVEALHQRKFGPGGPYHPDTPGPWKDTRGVRSSAEVYSEEFRECVALQAQHILHTFGKFPGTVPTILIQNYLQVHHLDLEFYDRYFTDGAYLETHARHMERWHAS